MAKTQKAMQKQVAAFLYSLVRGLEKLPVHEQERIIREGAKLLKERQAAVKAEGR